MNIGLCVELDFINIEFQKKNYTGLDFIKRIANECF